MVKGGETGKGDKKNGTVKKTKGTGIKRKKGRKKSD